MRFISIIHRRKNNPPLGDGDAVQLQLVYIPMGTVTLSTMTEARTTSARTRYMYVDSVFQRFTLFQLMSGGVMRTCRNAGKERRYYIFLRYTIEV